MVLTRIRRCPSLDILCFSNGTGTVEFSDHKLIQSVRLLTHMPNPTVII